MTRIAVAAISARVLAEAAHADGFHVDALDLFGDTDTRDASASWAPIGAPGSLHVDGERLLAGLAATARRGEALGWVAGSGFEGRADLLDAGAALLPLLGNGGACMRRVRTPQTFFAALDAAGVVHPEVRVDRPADRGDWLAKDAHGCGGWHIARVDAGAAQVDPGGAGSAGGQGRYFQRVAAGLPMSATFIADGMRAQVLGINELIVRPIAGRPYVYCGAVGPVAVAPSVSRQVRQALGAVAAEFGLRGLGSLDFMLDGDVLLVLEVNPRPPATLALYGDLRFGGGAQGVFAAHVRACVHGQLDEPVSLRPSGSALASASARGIETVFARRAAHLDLPAVRRLASIAGACDLPAAAFTVQTGDPVCSVRTTGIDTASVRAQLDRAGHAVHSLLETSS